MLDLSCVPYDDGALPPPDLRAFMDVVVEASPSVILEIGTFNGWTTRCMAEALPSAVIHTLDLPIDTDLSGIPDVDGADKHLIARRDVGRAFRGQHVSDRIRQHYGDSMTWDFSLAGRPDFFFIDGCHTYDGCRNDSEKCLSVCAVPATIVWHDYDAHHRGVMRLIDEWIAMGRDIRRVNGLSLACWRLSSRIM